MRFFHAEKVPQPRSEQVIPVSALPLDIEIGAGVGYHSIRYALAHPDRQLVAIEKTKDKFARFESRLKAHHISNLTAVHDDAIAWITHRLGDQTLGRCFLLFPNPNPKNPAARWFRMPFLAHLIEKFNQNTTLELSSNERWYVEEAIESATELGLTLHQELEVQSGLKINEIEVPRTHFEKKYLQRGERCWNLVFMRSLRR